MGSVIGWGLHRVGPDFIIIFASNQRRANKREAMELDDEIESRLSAAQTTLNIQVRCLPLRVTKETH